MRITQNVLSNQMIQSLHTQSDLKALVGKVLTGQIVDIQSNQTATLLTAKGQLTVDISGANLQNNQWIDLKVLEVKDGTLLTKMMPQTNGTSALDAIFSKLGMTDTTENIAILEALKKADLPIQQDTIKAMKQAMSEVKILISEMSASSLEGNPTLFDGEIDLPLKSLAIKWIQQTQSSQTQGSPSQPQVVSPQSQSVLSQIQNAQFQQQIISASSSTLEQNPSMMTPLDADDTLLTSSHTVTPLDDLQNPIISTKQAETDRMSQPGETQTKINGSILKAIQEAFSGSHLEAVQSLLENFNYQNGSLILKNALPMSIKNIFLAYDALNENSGISQRFIQLIQQLESAEISPELTKDILKHLQSEGDSTEKLSKIYEAIERELPESVTKSNIEKELAVIKESVVLNKSLNDQMMYMQLPLPINQQLESVALYYKKKGKKPNPDDLTLLVALNTHHFGEVRCVVHKLENQYNLSFRFKDDATMAYFETYKHELIERLEQQPDKIFVVQFSVSQSEDFDNLNDPSHMQSVHSMGLDLKV